MNWAHRLATEPDVPELERLIHLSVRVLQAPYYSAAQIEAALGPAFGVDRQLIEDQTYYVVECDGRIIGCGGWSRRKSFFGGDAARVQADPALDPSRDAARVRAFFVRPGWARRGVGRAILLACEEAIAKAGFSRIELVATLAGELLYARFGYSATECYDVPLRDGLTLPVVRMTKRC
jgi:GNAT superfamily N-acetyltransferase